MNEIDYIVNKIYLSRRENAEIKAALSLRRALKIPEYAKTAAEISENEKAIRGLAFDRKYEEIRVLEQKNDKLKNALEDILRSLDISPVSLKPKYHCNTCGDTGATKNGERCPDCYAKTRSEALLSYLDIPRHSLMSFDGAIAPNGLERYYESLKKMCASYPKHAKCTLIFSGKTGTGKTYLASCAANELKKNGFSSLFLTSNELNSIFLKCRTDFSIDQYKYLELLNGCDLLVIDDLGTEPLLKNVTVEYYTSVLSERIATRKLTIITTNMTIGEIQEKYSERFSSRMFYIGTSAYLDFSGKDLRNKN